MWEVVGHQGVVRLLERARTQDRLAPAYLLVGPPHVGKGTVALALAKAVNCRGAAPPCGECDQCRHIDEGRHPDVRVLEVQEVAGQRAISIDAVREVQRQAYLRPFEGQWRVTIIDGAEYLSEPAANALLKTLEEPPPHVLLVLLATNAEAVLPTIRSRCQRLEHRPLAEEAVAQALESRWEVPSDQAQELARLCRGSIGWALRAWRDPTVLETRARRLERLIKVSGGSLEERFAHAGELAALLAQERSAVREVLELWSAWWRDMLVVRAGAVNVAVQADPTTREQAQGFTVQELVAALRALLRTQDLLDRNVNPRLALEELALSLPYPRGAQ